LAACYALWQSPAQLGFWGLALASMLGALGWLGAMFALRHPAVDDIMGLVAHLPVVRRLVPQR
jgi:hypothetical protein